MTSNLVGEGKWSVDKAGERQGWWTDDVAKKHSLRRNFCVDVAKYAGLASRWQLGVERSVSSWEERLRRLSATPH